MMTLYEQLKNYIPCNEQEERDKAIMLEALSLPDVFTRDNKICHFTTSAWVVNSDRSKVLFAYHNIYNSWAWLGGHADAEKNLLSVSLREAQEESGIKSVKSLSDTIFSIEVLTVDGHIKNGEYVSSHLHLNVTYLLEADDKEPLTVNRAENSAVAWLSLDEVIDKSDEQWFKEVIYPKLISKTKGAVAAKKVIGN